MRVLITGALGRVGVMTVEEALRQGHTVRATDLSNPKNEALANKLRARGVEVLLGNLLDEDFLRKLFEGVDGVIHNAAVLPPYSEGAGASLAEKVNVGVTNSMIRIIEGMNPMPRFVFPSSFTIFGTSLTNDSLKQIDDTPAPDSNYTRHKLACEEALKASRIPYVIGRLVAAVDSREIASGLNLGQLRMALAMDGNNPMHWIHPKDVALAQVNALTAPEAERRVFHLGGDNAKCRVKHYDLIAAAFLAMGLKLSPDVFGTERFNGHWVDATESNRVLQFQRHDFESYRKEYRHQLRFVRPVTVLLSPLINPLLGVFMRWVRDSKPESVR